jgi:hypothetical protein
MVPPVGGRRLGNSALAVGVGVSQAAPFRLPLPLTQTPLPGQWTFWAEAMTPPYQRLGMVDVSSFYCVRRFSAFGHGNLTVNLPCGLDTETMLTLWSWRVWALYDGEPYWCGVPTGFADQNGSEHVQFSLIELPGYLTRRQWERDEIWKADQLWIARQLAEEPLRDVGVEMITEGQQVIRDRHYEPLEGGSRGQLLINLCGVINGPEFRTEYRMTPQGRPVCTVRVAYPRVGADTAGLGVSVPGAVLSYRAQFDSDQLRTRTYAVGDLPADAPEGTRRPVVIVDRPQPRLPRLDSVDDWPGTILIPTLVERASTQATINAVPAQQISGSPPESYPVITSYGPGDTVTVRAVTPLIPEGIVFAARLEQVEVHAAEGIATWQLGVVNPPQRPRETVAGAFTRINRTTEALFRGGGLNVPNMPRRLE